MKEVSNWVEQLDARLAQLPAQGDTAAERVIDALDRNLTRSSPRHVRLAPNVGAALLPLACGRRAG